MYLENFLDTLDTTILILNVLVHSSTQVYAKPYDNRLKNQQIKNNYR